MLDLALQAVLASLIVQGFKAIGFDLSGTPAKVVALVLAGLFLFGNGLIDLFVPVDMRPLLQQAIDLLKAVLSLFATPGVYGFFKTFFGKK